MKKDEQEELEVIVTGEQREGMSSSSFRIPFLFGEFGDDPFEMPRRMTFRCRYGKPKYIKPKLRPIEKIKVKKIVKARRTSKDNKRRYSRRR